MIDWIIIIQFVAWIEMLQLSIRDRGDEEAALIDSIYRQQPQWLFGKITGCFVATFEDILYPVLNVIPNQKP